MKGLHNSFAILFLILVFTSTSSNGFTQSFAEDHFDAENWSGTLTLTEIWISKHSGNYSEFIYKSHDIYNVQKMSATIRNGAGTAISNYSKREENVYREKVANIDATTTTKDNGSASGSGPTTLTISYDEDTKTYALMVPTPGISGEAVKVITCSGCGGPDPAPKKYKLGEEPSGIMVEDQKLGKDPNVLTGETISKEVSESGESHEVVIRWNLYRGKEDQWLQVVPQKYNDWMPSAGTTELTPGSKLLVSFELKRKNGKAPSQKVDHFELQLVKTSREPGITINFPVSALPAPKPDIQLLDQPGAVKGADGQTISIPCKDGISGSVTIGAFDGGGFTTLQVVAVIRGGMRLAGRLETEDGDTDIQLPKRESGSRIATKWLIENGHPAENADNETSAGNQHHGDGLSAYEEYRGVISEGKFIRLNPAKKELLVQVNKEDLTDLNGGLVLFATSADVTIVKLWATELSTERILNKNAGSSHLGEQYALRLKKGTLAEDVMGENQPAGTYDKTPKESVVTVIDVAQIRSAYTEQEKVATAAGIPMPYTAADDIANTVAHELAHGVKVAHHGEPSAASGKILKSYSGDYKIYAPDGSERTARPDTVSGIIGVPGSEASGDATCIMAYTSAYQWVLERGASREFIYRAVPLLAPGKILCTSATGTGINANGYFKNATKGNCLSQMVINTAH